jgi:hypothetical protein
VTGRKKIPEQKATERTKKAHQEMRIPLMAFTMLSPSLLNPAAPSASLIKVGTINRSSCLLASFLILLHLVPQQLSPLIANKKSETRHGGIADWNKKPEPLMHALGNHKL